MPGHACSSASSGWRLRSTIDKEGAGLGLTIVRTIIENHNGQVGVESEEGRGSTFWFWLPAA